VSHLNKHGGARLADASLAPFFLTETHIPYSLKSGIINFNNLSILSHIICVEEVLG